MRNFRRSLILLTFYVFGMISGVLIGKTYDLSNLIPQAVSEKHVLQDQSIE